ncbi:hypothetical protein QBC33DRAFT_544269 [Phialemonium atrogriseum]|uniref:Uncharacterized protein n=1 Tax=Phialemonium atrogriseum TaxID=1093897 RepID=A0AAJ0BYG5_9PEZI|nr:uncharacterized protein QBC33DRAFT_544269 [Phialemonium atrogriseum]KAK1765424.1 hypothetical protein QBC33DRAFT_544269 [Phialemonium atrogriseum]
MLAIAISAGLCTKTKEAIASSFWDTPASEITPSLDYYFKYYVKQCELIALHEGGSHTSLVEQKDITEIVALLRAHHTRDDIRKKIARLTSVSTSNGTQDYSIDLAARLLLMIEVGNLPWAYSGFRQLEWDKGSLRDFITQYFEETPVLGHDNIKLEKIFNARRLGTIAGMEIIWTSNLADHLRLMKDDKAVAVFHHASFLKRQQQDNSLLPQKLVDETLATIALLFPKWDVDTRSWYKQEASLRGLDPYLIEIGHLGADKRRFEGFHYWHDRLVVLKQVFDESRPRTLQQWWNDRRNGVQWYTFWVAFLVLLLTIFFGLVQSIEGALQVYKAFHP